MSNYFQRRSLVAKAKERYPEGRNFKVVKRTVSTPDGDEKRTFVEFEVNGFMQVVAATLLI